jgi:photosystem II stability/assembly factor-like uncharacterized protein
VVGGFWWGCSRGSYDQGGIFTTQDAGLTWTRRLTGYVTEIARDPSNPDVLWAGVSSGLWGGGNGGVFKSADAGVTWSQQTVSGLPSGETGRVEVAVAPSNPNVVYALFETVNGGNPQFWRTTDGGATWRMMSTDSGDCNGQCWYDMVVKVHSSNSDIVYRGTVRIFKSDNGGATWRDLSGSWSSYQKVHQDTHALLVDPQDGGTVYVGCDGGIWKTADGGASFQNLNANLNLTQFYDVGIHPTDDGILVGGSQDNSSLARTGSDTWDLMLVTGDGFVSMIDPSDPQVVYTASYAYPWDDTAMPTVFRATDGPLGDYWLITDYGCGITPGDRIAWVTPYALDPHAPSTLFLGTHRMYRSADRGTHWTHVGPADMAGGNDAILSLTVSRTDGRYVYAGTTSGRVWRTADGGTTWSELSGRIPFTREVNDVEADPSDPSRAFIVLSGFGTAHFYAYDGSGWEAMGTGLPDVPANTVVAVTSSVILVGTDVGVYRSTDGGATFTPWNGGMPLGAVVMDLEFNPRTQTVTAGTYGRGAWQARVPDCVLSCSATGPTNALVSAQAQFSSTASMEGCTGTPTYAWDFGDGASSSEQNPGHAYAAVGRYTWTCTVSLEGQTCVQTGEVSVTLTPPPSVTSMRKLGSPFRIKVAGAYFQSGVKVQINGSEWAQVTRKSESTLVLGGGSSLKAAVPKGTPTVFTFTNPDGGRTELSWQW